MHDYHQMREQIKAISENESNLIANLSNAAALLHYAMKNWWTGFYIVDGEELVLGPFQGPVACTRIACGRGVCGSAWAKNRTIVVPDVEQFPGHIACSSASRSEIVVPIHHNNKVVAVLDIDSKDLNTFTNSDAIGLESITQLISSWFCGLVDKEQANN